MTRSSWEGRSDAYGPTGLREPLLGAEATNWTANPKQSSQGVEVHARRARHVGGWQSGKVGCCAYAPPVNNPRRSGSKLSCAPTCSSASARWEDELESHFCAPSFRLIWPCKADSRLDNREPTWISQLCVIPTCYRPFRSNDSMVTSTPLALAG